MKNENKIAPEKNSKIDEKYKEECPQMNLEHIISLKSAAPDKKYHFIYETEIEKGDSNEACNSDINLTATKKIS